MTPANLRPSEVSRLIVQVVLRDRISTSPDCSAVKRSLAVSGVNFTFCASPNTAAATARQKSTSMPVQLFCSSGKPNPIRLVFTPHCTKPLAFTSSSVPAFAAVAAIKLAVAANAKPINLRFITYLPFEMNGRRPTAFSMEFPGHHPQLLSLSLPLEVLLFLFTPLSLDKP